MKTMNGSDKSNLWFAVVNGYAASRKAGAMWEKVEEQMRAEGIVFHGARTGKAGNAAELAFDACMAGYRRFIAVGGDGTVHDVLNGIASFVEGSKESYKPLRLDEFTIGVIPLGSGNDWIRSLGIRHDIKDAVKVIANGLTGQQDVVRVSILDRSILPEYSEISVSYMINIGGVGIDARVCERVNRMKRQGKRGKILYAASLIHAISNRIPMSVKVICDDKEVFDGAFLSIAFGIGRYSGGGMRQTPEAVLDDGLLDVTVIPDIAMTRILCEAPRLFTGTFLKVPELTACRGRSVMVIPSVHSTSEPVEVDGEVVGKSPVRLEVLPEKINIIIPGQHR